ncbi:hypothetical protein [Streptomyces sediminimaris]|uniref:hypothetical protein n=1 Tax=Streptomyces sediminimaris TaxID=3383721 RepID=UPI003999E1EE
MRRIAEAVRAAEGAVESAVKAVVGRAAEGVAGRAVDGAVRSAVKCVVRRAVAPLPVRYGLRQREKQLHGSPRMLAGAQAYEAVFESRRCWCEKYTFRKV